MNLPDTWQATLALVLLISAMLGGALTAFLLLTDRGTGIDFGKLHGRTGVAGILLLLFAAILGGETHPALTPAIGFFVLTAMGGATVHFVIRWKGDLPVPLILGHAALAVAGLATFLFGVLW